MGEEEIKSPLQANAAGDVVEADLEKLRDEKCIPTARKMFVEIAADMIPEDANVVVDYNPVLKKLLALGVEADLNLTTENPYVFQLMLGMLSGLNRTVQECTTIPIDDVRYGAIGKKILGYVADANVTIGSVTPEQTDADFAPVKEKINALFAEEKLSIMEVKYIMDSMFEAFTAVNTGFEMAVNKSLVTIEEKLLDVDAMTDVSMGLIVEIQQKLERGE